MKPTEAQKIMAARRGSYAKSDIGYADETELLLLQQHFGELQERAHAKATKLKKARRK